MARLNGLFLLDIESFDLIYGRDLQTAIGERIHLVAPPQTAESLRQCPELLRNVDLLFGGWGMPPLDEEFLEQSPRLKGVFYGAGAIGHWATKAFWDRNILVTTASSANAIPVAEYALSAILFSLKHGWRLARETRLMQTFVERNTAPGNFGSVVGLVSMGNIARFLRAMLRPFDLKVIAYDPFLSQAEAELLGVRLVSLEELFATADVVSLHTPELKETLGLITGDLFTSMKHGATFINTARGGVVDEPEMIRVLTERRDLQAVLDVTEPEPPLPGSPLYTMENVVLTPHIAGSVSTECRRMGSYMLQELERYLEGKPLLWQVTPEAAVHSCHRTVGDRLQQRAAQLHDALAV